MVAGDATIVGTSSTSQDINASTTTAARAECKATQADVDGKGVHRPGGNKDSHSPLQNKTSLNLSKSCARILPAGIAGKDSNPGGGACLAQLARAKAC